MLREHDRLFRRLLLLADLLIVAGAFFAAYFVRSEIETYFTRDQLKHVYPVESYLSLLPLILFLWAASLNFFNAYRAFRNRGLLDVINDIFKAGFFSSLFFGGFAYLLNFHYVSRTFISVVFLISGLLLILQRVALVQALRVLRKHGFNYRYVLIVGTGFRACKFAKLVHDHAEWGYRIAGFVDNDVDRFQQLLMGYPVLGTLDDLPAILSDKVVDEVVFVVPRSWLAHIEGPMLLCEQLGKRISVGVDYFNMQFAKAKQTDFAGFPLLIFDRAPDKVIQVKLKRLIDIVVSSGMLFFLSPFFLLVAVLIKATSEGPVFFKQTRANLNGRKFTLYKFRTMVKDAEQKLDALKEKNEMQGPVFKMTDDPRLTPLGRWMRKYSIDEFPQLINVLIGDMSLVGPRPPIPNEVKQYAPWQRRRLSMRPGLTCLWQISGRNEIADFDQWMRMDLEYIDRWSLMLDFEILLKTIPAVLLGRGAK